MESTYITDQTVFKQTREQKAQAKAAKKEWLQNMKVFYGKDGWRKQNNYPTKLKN